MNPIIKLFFRSGNGYEKYGVLFLEGKTFLGKKKRKVKIIIDYRIYACSIPPLCRSWFYTYCVDWKKFNISTDILIEKIEKLRDQKYFVETFFYDKDKNCYDLADYFDSRLFLAQKGLLKGEEKMRDCIIRLAGGLI